MPERSYNQYCPIAHALDIVGDRWALLIVRDLLLGPKRFSDLREGLPGIGTNILTDRLKGLERAQVVQRRVLPPPAASTVYELTAYGCALEAPLNALAQWGGQTLGAAQASHVVSRDSVLLTVRALVRSFPSADVPRTYALEIVDARLSVRVTVRAGARDAVILEEGSVGEPDVVFSLDIDTLFALVGGSLRLGDAVRQGKAGLRGQQELVAKLCG